MCYPTPESFKQSPDMTGHSWQSLIQLENDDFIKRAYCQPVFIFCSKYISTWLHDCDGFVDMFSHIRAGTTWLLGQSPETCCWVVVKNYSSIKIWYSKTSHCFWPSEEHGKYITKQKKIALKFGFKLELWMSLDFWALFWHLTLLYVSYLRYNSDFNICNLIIKINYF